MFDLPSCIPAQRVQAEDVWSLEDQHVCPAFSLMRELERRFRLQRPVYPAPGTLQGLSLPV